MLSGRPDARRRSSLGLMGICIAAIAVLLTFIRVGLLDLSALLPASVLLAGLAVELVLIRRSRRMIRRDLEKSGIAGGRKDLSAATFASLLVTIVAPGLWIFAALRWWEKRGRWIDALEGWIRTVIG